MRVLSAKEMASVDRRAIEEIGVPSLVLMENAALGVVDALTDAWPTAESALILCGPGNNGGDGLAVARHLDLRGYRLRVFLLVPKEKLGGDAEVQLRILEGLGVEVEEATGEDDVSDLLAACARADLVIDALFGTGLSRPLEGRFADLVEGINELPVPVLAVDIPSGLDGSKTEPPGPHLRADVTVTFGTLKIAQVLPPSEDAVGRLVVADLGVPRSLAEEAEPEGRQRLHLTTEDDVRACLAPRDADAHKGTFGHVVVVGGSAGKSGAVVLAARAAVRSGAGLVTAVVPPPLLDILDVASVESMSLLLDEGDAEYLRQDDVAQIAEFCAGDDARKDAVAIGPGVGRADDAWAAVRRLAAELDVPVVIDADGLNALAADPSKLRERGSATVLTPHPGEAARLLAGLRGEDVTSGEVQADRRAAVAELAEGTGSVVVLKGYRTLVADPSGEIWINPTGNAGMATGGTGDVLTGVVVALLARGWDAFAAARVAAWVHGRAGDRAAESRGETGLAAGDLVDALPATWRDLEA